MVLFVIFVTFCSNSSRFSGSSAIAAKFNRHGQLTKSVLPGLAKAFPLGSLQLRRIESSAVLAVGGFGHVPVLVFGESDGGLHHPPFKFGR